MLQCLLESAVKCVAVHSLPRHSLSHGRCFQIAQVQLIHTLSLSLCVSVHIYLPHIQCLVDIMVTCPHKNLVSMFMLNVYLS